MDKKTMFNEALAKLVSYATAHDNLITMEDVKSSLMVLLTMTVSTNLYTTIYQLIK